MKAARPPKPPQPRKPQPTRQRTRLVGVEIEYREHDDPNRERSLVEFLADLVEAYRRGTP